MIALIKCNCRGQKASDMAWKLSLSNLDYWTDVCINDDDEWYIAVGAQSAELIAKGLWRRATYFEGARV